MSVFLSGLATTFCFVMYNQYSQTDKRSVSAGLIAGLLAVCLYSLLLLVFQRPVFSLIASLTLLGVVLIVNKTKLDTLREPLVASDFLMYAQVFRFPRLYLPFLKISNIIVLTIALPLTIGLALYMESRVQVSYLWLISLILLTGGFFYVLAKRLEISTDIQQDHVRYGLLACLAAYFIQSFTVKSRHPFESELANHALPACSGEMQQADIVIIQSESFFDVRRLSSAIKTDLLDTYDDFCQEAHHSGRLIVPAWGANTLRTEFSFLSGMSNNCLGLYRYYPYFFMENIRVQTLPMILRDKGYKTICIHPYQKDFFRRHQVFETLGFDEFIDIQQFHDAERFGPYVSDISVASKITDHLKSANQPTFVFAITMENHGPLYLEDIEHSEIKTLCTKAKGNLHRDVAIYARHIKNTDRVLKQLQAYFSASKKPALLGFYGDHLPALSHCFDDYGFTSTDSDYFLWSNYIDEPPRTHDLAIEALASSIIQLINRAKKVV